MSEADKYITDKLGKVHVYTGAAKGKTTACVGLAVRAAGHGLKTYIGQFLKGRPTGEVTTIREHLGDYIEIEQFGREGFVRGGGSKDEDRRLAQKGLERVREILRAGKHHLVILDEINVAVFIGLVDVGQVEELVKGKPEKVELVLSGREASPKIMELADLVTEMKKVKHYFDNGLPARKGIEE